MINGGGRLLEPLEPRGQRVCRILKVNRSVLARIFRAFEGVTLETL
jgi:hypothetical protein